MMYEPPKVKHEVIGIPISRLNRQMTVVTYTNGTALISITSNGVSFSVHLDVGDVVILVNALTYSGDGGE